ncbi:unnamed protein product [Rhodiola kirilowii]
MLLRSVLAISKRRGITRLSRQNSAQTIPFASSRNEFSTAAKCPTPTGKPSESGSSVGKIIFCSTFIGAAGAAAYQYGYLDQYLGKTKHGSSDTVNDKVSKDIEEPIVLSHIEEPTPLPHGEKPTASTVDAKEVVGEVGPHTDTTASQELVEHEEPNVSPGRSPILNQEKVLHELQGDSLIADVVKKNLVTSIIDNQIVGTDTKSNEKSETSESTVPPTQQAESDSEDDTRALPPPYTKNITEDTPTESFESAAPLLDAYNLRENSEEGMASLSNEDIGISIDETRRKEDHSDAYISEDGKLVLDLLQAIHAAEKRQAEIDAHVFAEEKRMLKEHYEKELKDARARELMYAEEAAILDKELNKERVKAMTALKSLQEKAEEKLRMELEQKEKEADQELKKVQELAKAELAAAIAKEKAGQIEKMAEANLHINALSMAFFARSEEARQTHSVYKLALGALALEDALLKGLPVQKEIEALHKYVEGIDKDSLVDLVLSTLPEEARHCGTDTLLQLNMKFDTLKVTLRHFSLIPPGGGGILAHVLAHAASFLKVKETGEIDGGVDSVISRVEKYLAEGKLIEAADALEEGLQGTQAAEVVEDWVTRARNRAITEQALTLLQSYATSISFN